MSTEQLPDDLQMAYEFARAVWPVAGTTADKRMSASDAIRTEHTKRLTLQHHACDLAQRIADLERHAANLVSESEAKSAAMQAAFEERLTLQHHAADQVWRIADLEVKCVTLKELHDAAADERDELRARLAEIEAQEPVAFTLQFEGSQRINTDTTYRTQRLADEYADGCAECGSDARPIVTPLYASPVPAQAVPTGERQAVLLTDAEVRQIGDATLYAGGIYDRVRAIETAVLAANGLEVRRG